MKTKEIIAKLKLEETSNLLTIKEFLVLDKQTKNNVLAVLINDKTQEIKKFEEMIKTLTSLKSKSTSALSTLETIKKHI